MLTLEGYLADLASSEPAPGGGSAAMVVGAAACALLAMVARICARRAKAPELQPLAERLIGDADTLRARMLDARVRDEAAFAAVVAARGNPDAVQRALQVAAGVPLAGAAEALRALQLCAQALELRNPHVASDIGCAAEFAMAALNACAYNVRINHRWMKDDAEVSSQRLLLEGYEKTGADILATLRRALAAPAP